MKKKIINEKNQKQFDGKITERSESPRPEQAEGIMNERQRERLFKDHLRYSKVIRDSVHGDIWLTDLEIEIIDTPVFQRLRRIKQLGPTDLVFPSAKHTRFEHSIGALFVAQQIIDSINKNHDNDFSDYAVNSRDTITIRILALIHDMAHLPFGHTIEDEGKLFEKKQWLDEKRYNYILDIIQPIIESRLADIPAEDRDKIIQDIRSGLRAEEGVKDENIHNLARPYIVDIVGNTICADLLDYLKRDADNTGLKIVYDPRILSYFVLVDYTKKINGEDKQNIRAAILLEKKQGKIKNDILNYCVDLLRMRYSLAEKSHYHRVKCIASAMVIKMVYCALEAEMITDSTVMQSEKNNLMELGDDSLIFSIINDNGKESDFSKAAKKLANSLFNRQLYREIYSKNYAADEAVYDTLTNRCLEKQSRYEKERELEQLFSLDPGSIVIYCPEKQSGKVAETKTVRLNTLGEKYVRTLKELANENQYRSNINLELSTLENLYNRLWNFYILVNKECITKTQDGKKIEDAKKIEYIKEACQEFIDLNLLGKHTITLRAFNKNVDLTGSEVDSIVRNLASAKDPREVKNGGIKYIDKMIDDLIASKHTMAKK